MFKVLLSLMLANAFYISAEILPDAKTKQLFEDRRQAFPESELRSTHLIHSKGISVQARIYQSNDEGKLATRLQVLVKNELKTSISICKGNDFDAIEPSLKTNDGTNVPLNEKGKAWRRSKNMFSHLSFFEMQPDATESFNLDLDYLFQLPPVSNTDIIVSGMIYYSTTYSPTYSDKLPILAVPFSVTFGPGAKKELETASVVPVASNMDHIRSSNQPEKKK